MNRLLVFKNIRSYPGTIVVPLSSLKMIQLNGADVVISLSVKKPILKNWFRPELQESIDDAKIKLNFRDTESSKAHFASLLTSLSSPSREPIFCVPEKIYDVDFE